MRQDLHDPNLFNAILKSAQFSHARRVLVANYIITANGPIVNFLDPNGAHRDVTLPARKEGLFYIIANIGTSFNLLVKDFGGTLRSTVAPGQTLDIYASESEWQGSKATTNLDVFTNTVNGLVPAPNSALPGSLFLRDDGQWAQVQVVGIVDAFKYISDGTNIATGAGPDTFRLRSSTGSVGITVTNNEAVFGDNANFDVIEGAVDHNALLNYVADQHVPHSGVSISAGQGLTGGGNIAASRTLALDINGLSVIAPVLADSIPFYDLSGLTQGKTTFTVLNGILVHNSLSGVTANEHINHTSVSIIAGVGLSGGGDISASRTLNIDFTEFATDDSLAAGDLIPWYDVSEADHNTVPFSTFNTSLDHNALTNYVADQHIAHSGVTLTAGAGLTGGGTIAASRTFTVGAGAGITVNADDVALAAIADLRIMANVSGSSTAPGPTTLTAIIDAILGNTRGAIITRQSGAWVKLDPGASGTVLTSGGVGADLSYTSTGAGDVTAAAVFAVDNRLIRSDGTAKGVQASGVTLDDSANMSGVGTLGSGVHTITAANGMAIAVGRQGATSPAFAVDSSIASCITGVQIIARATTGGVDLESIGETNVDFRITARGSGSLILQSGTGVVTSPMIVTFTNATEATATNNGAVRLTGGLSVAKTVYTNDFTMKNGSGSSYVIVDSLSGQNSGMRLRRNGNNEWLMFNNNSTDAIFILDADEAQGVTMAQNATAWSASSDVRMKYNIRPLNVLARLDTVEDVGFEYVWKNTGKHDLGVIAQWFHPLFPSVITEGSYDEDYVPRSLADEASWKAAESKVGVIALQGVQQLYRRVKELERKMK